MFYYQGYEYILIAFMISSFASFYLQSNYQKAYKKASDLNLTGREVAELVLRNNGIYDISVISIPGNLTDNFNPKNRVISLSKPIYSGSSIASISVAAHEAGHAVQLEEGYLPLLIRHSLIRITSIASSMSYIFIMLGFFVDVFFAKIGIAMFLIIFIFQVITLPVEINASRRALKELEVIGADRNDLKASGIMLRAAALTYIAGMLTALLELMRYISIFTSRDNRR